MPNFIQMAHEDLQSAYDNLSNALEQSRESKDNNESRIMDAMNRVSEAMSHNNVLVASLPQDTVSDETVQMKAVSKNARGN